MAHPLLDKIALETAGADRLKTVASCGHEYALQSLRPEADYWASQVVAASDKDGYLGFLQAVGMARVACALQSIDGVHVEDLWPVEGENPRARDVRRRAVLDFLLNQTPAPVVSALVRALSDLDVETAAAAQGMRDLSTGTPSSG